MRKDKTVFIICMYRPQTTYGIFQTICIPSIYIYEVGSSPCLVLKTSI